MVDPNNLEKLNRKQYRYIKINMLLHAYFNRLFDKLTESDITDIINVLPICAKLTGHMFECIQSLRPSHPIVALPTVKIIMQLYQMIYQALYTSFEPYKQLPGLTNEDISKIKSKCNTFVDLLTLPIDTFKGLIDDEKLKDIENIRELLPKLKVDIKCHVADEDEILAEDLVTVTINIKVINWNKRIEFEKCYSN